MANQPTKYKKFVATAATATLVASAIVPVASAASFTDVNPETNSHAAAIDALVEQGIINGYQDGTFKPNATLTRGHVVKMLGKWVEAQGFEVPADWNTVARFSDLAVDNKDQELVKYAAVVKDAGVFNGSNGALNAAGSITRENMALTLDRAYAAVFGQSLVEEAAGLVDLTVSDLASAKEEAREAIQALRNLEVSNVNTFMPKDAVTRAQFASFLYRTINVEGGNQTTPPTGEVAIASVKASKANELTVEFNQAVDTNAAAFAVKKGATEEIKVSDVEWNEAGTVATLTVDHKFAASTYNLTVTGLSEEALTASVTTTNEVVTEIKFNNDKLVLTGKKSDDGEALEARITFEVYNQYGEIITDKVADSYYDRLKVKGLSTLVPKLAGVQPQITKEAYFDLANKGTIIAWVDKKEKEGETGSISFTYEFGDIEIDVDQDIVLSDDMEPGTVKVEGIHSVRGYDFTSQNAEKYGKNRLERDANGNQVTKIQEEFYLLLNVKDQYGNPISAKDANKKNTTADSTTLEVVEDGIRVSVSEDEIFDADERNLTTITVDGKDYFAIPVEFDFNREGYVEQTGENTVSIRSKATGEVTEAKIVLEDSSKVYSVGLSAPAEVVASDETVKLPVTVLDQNGNAILDAAKLNKDVQEDKIKFSGDIQAPGSNAGKQPATFIFENGALYLEFESIVNSDDKKSKDMDIEVEVVNTDQESEITLQVQPAAYATTLVRLKSDVSKYVFEGQDLEVELEDFIVEDQYGRVMDKAFENGAYVTANILGKATEAKFELTTDSSAALVWKEDKFVFKTSSADTSSIEFVLHSKDNTQPQKKDFTSKATVTFRTIEPKEFDSYKVKGETLAYVGREANGAIPAAAANPAEIKVYGVLGNGIEIELPRSEYAVINNSYFADVTAADSDKAVKTFIGTELPAAAKLTQDKIETFKSGVNIVINYTGEVITQELSFTDAAPKYAKITLEDDTSLTGKDLTKVKLPSSNSSNITSEALSVWTDIIVTSSEVEIVDQYKGKLVEDANDLTKDIDSVEGKLVFTISNVNAANDDYKIIKNGTNDASIEGLSVGDTYDLTVKIDNATTTVKVQVVKGNSNN